MAGFWALLALACSLAFSGPPIDGEYLDEDVPQSCGIFEGEEPLCSATIIGPRYALSAAHCLRPGMNPAEAGVGEDKARPYHLRCGRAGEVRAIIAARADRDYVPWHDDHKGRDYRLDGGKHAANDRLLLGVEGEAFSAAPMALAEEADFEALEERALEDCRVAGWGLDAAGGSGALRAAEASALKSRRGGELIVARRRPTAVLAGDSGGTLACRREGAWRLVGVIAGSGLSRDQFSPARLSREALLDPFMRAYAAAQRWAKSHPGPIKRGRSVAGSPTRSGR